MPRSFAARLALTLGLIGAFSAVLTAIIVNLAFGGRFNSYLHSQQTTRERQLVRALEGSYRRAGGWESSDLQSSVGFWLMDGGTLRVLDSAGRLVWRASPSAGMNHMSGAHRDMMGSGPLGAETRVPLVVGGSTVGTAVMRLPASGLLPQDVSFRSSVNRVLLWTGVAVALLSVFLGILLARRGTRPVRELTDAARAMAHGDRTRRVDSGTNDEFGEMADAFNSLADSIDEEDGLRKMFAADVAHELRTPLAILQSEVEGIQDGVLPSNGETWASLHDEVLRLGRLVGDLETMAAADAARFAIEPRPVDLGELVARTLAEFDGAFVESGVGLSHALSPVVAVVDPARIQQVVVNLVSNALKFTPAGGRVRVRLETDGTSARLSVADTGPGIPPQDLPHVFERYWRGSGARVRGSGIGLAVVSQLVEAHHGTVGVESGPNGSVFTVELPEGTSGSRRSFTGSSQPLPTVAASRR